MALAQDRPPVPDESERPPLHALPATGGPGRDGPMAIAIIIAALAVLGSMVAIGFGMRAIDESKKNVNAAGASTAAAASSAPANTAPATFDVSIGEFYVKPASITVAPGQPIVVNVTNTGTMAHDLMLNGTQGTARLNPGGKETVKWAGLTKSADAWCTVPGHKAAGMVLHVVVSGAAASSTAGSTQAAPAADTSAVFDPNATPAADFKPFDPTLQPADGAVEHKITLHATEVVKEVAPGVKQQVWTFNNQVPAPILRGHVGDLFTVTLVNDGTIGHSIDFHASQVAWSDEMRTINPGQSLVYQFKANFAGIFMYHCGTAPALHHIGNGMYGAVVIDPPNLPPVDHEYVLIQSEFYLGPQGQPGDLAKMQKGAWDIVAFNGYANQYKFAPIKVDPNQRIRVWVLDAGPSENSSFHIVGTIFDTVFKEGSYLLKPGSATQGGSQTLDLQPAQGGFVEFTLAEQGLYPIVTHKFANPGKGAMGLFMAGDVPMTGNMSH
jgi:nitrite reductase (NO-forming)